MLEFTSARDLQRYINEELKGLDPHELACALLELDRCDPLEGSLLAAIALAYDPLTNGVYRVPQKLVGTGTETFLVAPEDETWQLIQSIISSKIKPTNAAIVMEALAEQIDAHSMDIVRRVINRNIVVSLNHQIVEQARPGLLSRMKPHAITLFDAAAVELPALVQPKPLGMRLHLRSNINGCWFIYPNSGDRSVSLQPLADEIHAANLKQADTNTDRAVLAINEARESEEAQKMVLDSFRDSRGAMQAESFEEVAQIVTDRDFSRQSTCNFLMVVSVAVTGVNPASMRRSDIESTPLSDRIKISPFDMISVKDVTNRLPESEEPLIARVKEMYWHVEQINEGMGDSKFNRNFMIDKQLTVTSVVEDMEELVEKVCKIRSVLGVATSVMMRPIRGYHCLDGQSPSGKNAWMEIYPQLEFSTEGDKEPKVSATLH